MMRMLWAFLVLTLSLLGTFGMPASKTSKGTAQIFVADYQSSEMLEGASIFVLSKDDGVVKLGTTDVFGRLELAETVMDDEATLAILACGEYYQCGAILLDSNVEQRQEEYYLSIPPLSLR